MKLLNLSRDTLRTLTLSTPKPLPAPDPAKPGEPAPIQRPATAGVFMSGCCDSYVCTGGKDGCGR